MPIHYRTCNLCEAMCGLEIEYEGNSVISIKGDKQDPFSRGHICPKAVALRDIYEDPDRLKKPLRKTADGWEEMEWEEALDYAADRLRGMIQNQGPQSLGIYIGNPVAHNLGSMLNMRNFIRSLKTKNRFSATSADQLPHHFAALMMFGHYLLMPVPDIDRSQYMLILGANPMVSNGSLMTAPDVGKRLKAIQQRGGKLVVIDPRKSETGNMADAHHFIKPGTDAWLLLAMIHTLFAEGWVKPGPLADYSKGMEELEALTKDFSPEVAAPITGIPAATIREICQEFAEAEVAVCYGRMGLSTQEFGGLCQWLINVINILTGNLDRPGGPMFTLPAIDTVGRTGEKGHVGGYDRWRSRLRDLPEFAGELPVSEMADEILEPGEGQIKGMVTIAGNPVLSTPDGQKVDRAFEQLDFMVSIDIYLNETTRHADLILPPTTGLETEQYDLIFHLYAIRNTSKYSPALFEKQEDQRHDWEILQALTARLSGAPHHPVSPAMALGFAMQKSPHQINFSEVMDQPHGVDLGPLTSCLPDRLLTPDKQIDLVPEPFVQDLERLRASAKGNGKTEEFGFRLIGRRQLRSNNSWMHNSFRLVKGKARCTLLIHPQDAEAAGLGEGDLATVSSRTGEVSLPVEITAEVMPGVVSIPHGWGHDRKGSKLAVAQAHAGVSINDLTDSQLIDELTGNAAFSGVPVKISAQ